MTDKLVQYNDLCIASITDNLSIMDGDWCVHLYNSEYSDYGVNIKFDELVMLRDALNEIIESRQSK